jgi:hypothetical protein
MNKHLCIFATACVAVVASAGPVLAAGACAMTETANVSINFNGYDKDVVAVKAKLDGKIAEIKTMAQDQHFTKFDIQSYNYSINANNNGGDGGEPQYQYSGSAGFQILPADKAVNFMVVLTKKGYHASVNVSSYRNGGNCE